MKIKNITRIIAIILLVSIILRFCFAIINIKHDCTHDDNCPICTLIHKLKKDLEGIKPDLIKIVFNVIFMFLSLTFCIRNRLYDKRAKTLVGIKVELQN